MCVNANEHICILRTINVPSHKNLSAFGVLKCVFVYSHQILIFCFRCSHLKHPSPLQYGGEALQLPFDRQVTFWGPSSRKFFLQR